MTENEAKEKWCPMVRLMWHRNGGGANCWVEAGEDDKVIGMVRMPDETKCIGSDCMSWRDSTLASRDENLPAIVSGYCGLAGKP